MALEITGSRILAPYFGNSLSVWGSLIGVVLTGLSLGYYLGGRSADRNPNLRTFSLIMFYAGIFILFIPFVSSQVLNLIANLDLGERFSSLLATTLLLAFPTVMLGMVSPYAIKLSTKNLNKLGNIAGNLYALSTLGSIFGTFFSVFYLVPQFGVKTIVLSLLGIYNRDGRVYITNSNKKYDLIVLDAYSKTYVPFHLMTKEFFMELKKDLTPDGIVASNMITSLLGDTSNLFKAEYKTISQIFPSLYVFPTRANSPGTIQNVLLFVTQTSYLSKDRLAENLHSINMSEFINYIENYYENPIYLEDAPVETLLNPVTEKPYQIEYRYQLYF